jgi:cytochrome d ubiquinol oxidase subunit II
VIGGTWLILMMIYYAFVSNHRISKLIPPEMDKKTVDKKTGKTN